MFVAEKVLGAEMVLVFVAEKLVKLPPDAEGLEEELVELDNQPLGGRKMASWNELNQFQRLLIE